MSNNIYDILKKIENLEAPRQSLTEGKKAKPDYIDIDKDGDKTEPMKKAAKEKSKGAVAEAVAQVERQLNEKYMGFKKRLGEESDMVRKVIPVNVIDGPGGYEEAQKRIKDHEASKVKRQELPGKELPPIEDRSRRAGDESGRPVKEEEMSIEELQRLINAKKEREFKQFTGEIPDDPEEDDTYPDITIKPEVQESGLQAYLGKKKYGEQGMRALQKAGREGAGKEKMARIRARHDKMDEGSKDIYNKGIPDQGIVGSGKPDPKERERYLDYPSYRDDQGTFYDQLGNPRQNLELKKQMDKDRDYPVYEPGLPPDRPVPRKMKEGEYNEDMLSPKQKQFAALADPKDKITYADRIAGAKKGKKTEGNKFSGNLMKARAQGLKRADLDGDGDMEPVREGLDIDYHTPDMDKMDRIDREQELEIKAGKRPPLSDREKQFNILAGRGAIDADIRGQEKYKDRMQPGIINKIKDYFDYDKPNPAYGPKFRDKAGTGYDYPYGNPKFEGAGTSMREGWEEMQRYLEKKRGPESKGGEGKKAGTRYGGSAQRDDDEEMDGEGQPAVKKKGRPKGTGGGAKFSFKKPKD